MSWQIAAIISTLLNHLSHRGLSLIEKYSCPPNLDTLEMDKCHCVWVQHSWFSSFLIIRMQCIMVFRLDVSCHQKYIHFTSPNIPITMQQARKACVTKIVCHVSPATSGKKMFYRYIIISQIDPIQPCL